MLKITLDTNCIINLLDYKSESAISVDSLSEIIRYAMESAVNVTITTRVATDLSKDKVDERKSEMLRKIEMFPVIGTVARVGSSTWGGGDFYSSDETEAQINELKNILFPTLKESDKHYGNKINDIDHLVGHLKHKRDIFVTDDIEILKKKETLETTLGIKVATPSEVVEILNSQDNKNVLANEYFSKLKEYRDWLIQIAEINPSDSDDEKYEEYREWFLKKTPKILDSLANIDFKKNSVAVGSQRVFDNVQLLGMQNRQKKFQQLFSKPNLEEQLKLILDGDSDLYYSHRPTGGKRKVIKEHFQVHLDNLLSLIGYTD